MASIDKAITVEQARILLGISRREIQYWREFGLGPDTIMVQGPAGFQPYYVKGEVEALARDKEKMLTIQDLFRAKIRSLGRKLGQGHRRSNTIPMKRKPD